MTGKKQWITEQRFPNTLECINL